MKRTSCASCQRPKVTCICHLSVQTNNQIHVVILQHPSEVKQTKGSVTLLNQSLNSSEVFIGEDFTDSSELHHRLSRFKKVAVLYPSDNAVEATPEVFFNKEASNSAYDLHTNEIILTDCCLILLDGTWKKAYKMFMLNPFLQDLAHITLPDNLVGNYTIRKTQKQGALSSLEACCYALSAIENQNSKYQPLLTAFNEFNLMQLAYRTVKE